MQVLSVIKKCYGRNIVEWDIVNQHRQVVVGGYQSLIKATIAKGNMKKFKDDQGLMNYILWQRKSISVLGMVLANG